VPIARRRLLALAAAAPITLAHPTAIAAADLPPDEAALPLLDDDYVGYVLVQRHFPETGHNVDGEFLRFFRTAGMDALGLPLTEAHWEPGAPESAGRTVQYFQRARLEYDPDTKAVQRSPLGDLLGKRQPAVAPAPGLRYVGETGHNVGHGFLKFLADSSVVETIGLPISEEVEEGGRIVQWFERGRLEWWPDARGRQVQLGLVGAEYLEAAAEAVPEELRRPAVPLEPLREWRLPPPPRRPLRPVAPLDIPVLYYHQVPAQTPLRDQLLAFKEAGRTIVPLSQAVAAVRGEATLPNAPLALTFDDGWQTQFTNAAPVLQSERVPATFFVITRFLDTVRGYMSWDQVRTLKDLGFEVESHTQNHADVSALYAANEHAAIAEIWESLAILEARLGRSQRLFAYPNGTWNARVAALVARVYRGAVATGGGTIQSQGRTVVPARAADSAVPPSGVRSNPPTWHTSAV
jgi:peptidoglycan/xylan/chitin deacetylase (PgdA/CDA1 family)